MVLSTVLGTVRSVGALLVMMLFVSAPVMAAKPIHDVLDHPITWPSGTPGSMDEVQVAVLGGLVAKGWTGTVIGPGHIRGDILVRGRHRAQIDITFDREKYSIVYVSSENLDYNPGKNTIHRNYNNWIIYLQQSIDQQLIQSQSP